MLAKQVDGIPLIQGPLAGYSNAAFRRQIWRWGKPLWATSEMISAKTLVKDAKGQHRYLYRHEEEGPLVYQLSGNESSVLAEATDYLNVHYKADGIDLNCGCPKKKIRKKGCGSKLLEDPDHLYHLLAAMRPHTPHLSAKIRIDGQSHDAYTADVIHAICAAGADCITLHARHWQEDTLPCNWEQAAKWIEISQIPVIINGNLDQKEEAIHHLAQTGAWGVMIARGSSGKPWLIGQMQGNKTPSCQKQYESLMMHLTDLATLIGKQKAYYESQSHLVYYARNLPWLKDWQQASSFDELILCLQRTFLSSLTNGE